MNNLLGNLLDGVSADPNDIPPGNYDGVVLRSEYVLQPDKDLVSHAVTLKVSEGDRQGAQKQVWYSFGKEVRNAEGVFPAKLEDIKAYQPNLSDNQKAYYKKLLIGCGMVENEINTAAPESIVGNLVTFQVYEKNGWKNVGTVEPRVENSTITVEGGAPFDF